MDTLKPANGQGWSKGRPAVPYKPHSLSLPLSLFLSCSLSLPPGSPVHVFDFEVYAHGGHEGLGEGVVTVAHEERRLPDARVAHNEDLVHVVEVRVSWRVEAVHLFHGTTALGGL